jgi:hypothetical protein
MKGVFLVKKSITFKIDGEWFTGFIRQRYWYEGLSYEDSYKLLESVLIPTEQINGDRLQEVINGILTGVKKLSGVNEFLIEDDNKFSEYSKFLIRSNLVIPEKKVSNDKVITPAKGIVKKVEIKVFDSERHADPFEYYDGTVDTFWVVPDSEFTSKQGLISPSGDYFGCTFASHLFLAQHLIMRDPVLRKQFESKYGDGILPEDRCLDFLLIDKGWIALRNPTGGEPRIDLGDYRSEEDLPQKILDTLYDYKLSIRNR